MYFRQIKDKQIPFPVISGKDICIVSQMAITYYYIFNTVFAIKIFILMSIPISFPATTIVIKSIFYTRITTSS